MSRRFLLRLALALVVMALLCAVGLVGFGWLVWTEPGWFFRAVGREREHRLWRAYEAMAGALLPGDRDGDGVSDGLELFLRTDPKNSHSHGRIELRTWDDELKVLEDGGMPLGARDVRNSLRLPFGERFQVRSAMLLNEQPNSFPAGFRLRISPPAEVRLGLPGATLDEKALVVAVGRDGSVAFDLDLPSETSWDPPTERRLLIDNDVTGDRLCEVEVFAIRLGPSFIPSTKETTEYDFHSEPGMFLAVSGYHLEWPLVSPPTDALLVEVARDMDGAEWHPLKIYQQAPRLLQAFGATATQVHRWSRSSSVCFPFDIPSYKFPSIAPGRFRS